jgi:hypothetical protein
MDAPSVLQRPADPQNRWLVGSRRICPGSLATPCCMTAAARSPTASKSEPAVLHFGFARFAVTGPVCYSMTAQEAVDIGRRLQWLPIGVGVSWPGEHTSLGPGSPMSERLTSPLTVRVDLQKRQSAQW